MVFSKKTFFEKWSLQFYMFIFLSTERNQVQSNYWSHNISSLMPKAEEKCQTEGNFP